MNPLTLEIGLRTAGLVLSGLVVANFFAASRWRYTENLAGAEPMVRQIFYVHCAYLISIMAGLALLCLGWPQLLMEGEMSRALCGFFGLFWGSRVVVQLTYYDKNVRRADRGWDVFFFGVFLFLGTIFTLTAIYQ
ncbi:MAG: hypothetical protein EOP85_13905 [Verrucomicrobiaceae bacterium]|nr:MAG: hypothetical protein EOP85_13905 [Verrucomicrobiaceae bacterium]